MSIFSGKNTPFTLYETEQYLISQGINWNRYQEAECYMILGGTPLYLQMLEKNLSLTQNVDNLFFTQNALHQTFVTTYGLKKICTAIMFKVR